MALFGNISPHIEKESTSLVFANFAAMHTLLMQRECQKVPDNVKKIVSKSKLPLVPAVSELEPTRLRELSLNNAKTYGEEYSEIEQEDDDNMTQSEI
ncbi:unnamed protein product, partial [Tenebrio molitor]